MIDAFIGIVLISQILLGYSFPTSRQHVLNPTTILNLNPSLGLNYYRKYSVVRLNAIVEKDLAKDGSSLNLDIEKNFIDDEVLCVSEGGKWTSTDQNLISQLNTLLKRIPREELPNVQTIPHPEINNKNIPLLSKLENNNNNNELLINDCTLSNKIFSESVLDSLLLSIFRKIVQNQINFISPKNGIEGLLEEGQYMKLSDTSENSKNQHIFVKNTLKELFTPFLPPFYRLFMSGMIPSEQKNDPKWLIELIHNIINSIPDVVLSKQEKEMMISAPNGGYQPLGGPLPYAPLLTSFVTPPFLSFLVGPSRMNRREDGLVGGMIVEKC
eukprot:gene15898-21559_t